MNIKKTTAKELKTIQEFTKNLTSAKRQLAEVVYEFEHKKTEMINNIDVLIQSHDLFIQELTNKYGKVSINNQTGIISKV